MASPDTGMKLVLLAGTMTFANEWYQAHDINYRVAVATVLAAAATAGVGRVSPGGAASIGVMALIVAASTPLNGKSPIQQLSTVIGKPAKGQKTVTSTQQVS